MKALAIVLAAALLSPAPGAPGRSVLVVDRGDRPIFALRIGREAGSSWGSDLLGFDGTIGVSAAREVRFAVAPPTCTYDVRATYDDGSHEVVHGVDLCRATRVDFGI